MHSGAQSWLDVIASPYSGLNPLTLRLWTRINSNVPLVREHCWGLLVGGESENITDYTRKIQGVFGEAIIIHPRAGISNAGDPIFRGFIQIQEEYDRLSQALFRDTTFKQNNHNNNNNNNGSRADLYEIGNGLPTPSFSFWVCRDHSTQTVISVAGTALVAEQRARSQGYSRIDLDKERSRRFISGQEFSLESLIGARIARCRLSTTFVRKPVYALVRLYNNDYLQVRCPLWEICSCPYGTLERKSFSTVCLRETLQTNNEGQIPYYYWARFSPSGNRIRSRSDMEQSPYLESDQD